MPAVENGAAIVASANVGEQFCLTLVPNASFLTSNPAAQIEADNLPNVFMYVMQTSGLVGLTFTPLVAFANNSAGLPDWQPLTSPQAVPLGVPIYFVDRISGASAFAIGLTAPAGAVNSDVTAVLGASQ